MKKFDATIDKRVKLSFDLSEYLLRHPKILDAYNENKLIIFVEGNAAFNQKSQTLVENFSTSGEAVIKAIRKKSKYNIWKFQPVNNHAALV